MTLPEVVIICGVSGSGKTSFSRRLEKDGYRRISLDEYIDRHHGETFPDLPDEQQRQIFASAAAGLADMAADSIRRGEKIVVDSTMCKRAARDRMRAVCKSLDAECRFIYLDVPYSELARRLALRRGTGPNDRIVPEERLKGFCRGFEVPDRAKEPDVTVIAFKPQ